MELKDLKITKSDFSLKDLPTIDTNMPKAEREKVDAKTAQIETELDQLQEALYADAREGVIVILQAMDAAGKDSMIRHVMGVFDPQGVTVTPFKQPSKEELAHDFLWRAELAVPNRGQIGIFNRSYYEDVLIARVRNLQKTYHMPPRCTDMSKDEFYELRYQDICNYENYLHNNGYRIVKIFLHLSKKEQAKRFLARINDPDKQWKFSAADLEERGLWDDYQKAYEKCIKATASEHAPWYVLPADRKWQARHYAARILRNVLKDCCVEYPALSDETAADIDRARAQLETELAK